MATLSPELLAVFGIVGVHLIPKLLQRFRIPGPVTALLLGMLVAVFAPTLDKDPTLYILATLGIASLFLFAGLEVDADELGARPGLLIGSLAAHALVLVAVGIAGVLVFDLDLRPAMILALGVGTPSGGFILDGLSRLGASDSERAAIRNAALMCELLSLVVFFFVTQSTSFGTMAIGTVAVALLLLLVPKVLRGLARLVLPYAPRSEFALLVLTAVCCAWVTRKLGIYYLLGAFSVGIIARRLEKDVPELASPKNLDAVELFATFFAPFYFARAGLQIDLGSIGLRALGLALGMVTLLVPLRILVTALVRRATTREPTTETVRVGAALVPTFVFSLVMAQLLATAGAPPYLPGALVLFAILNAFVPQMVLARIPMAEEPAAAAAVPAERPAADTPEAVVSPESQATTSPAAPSPNEAPLAADEPPPVGPDRPDDHEPPRASD